MSGKQPLTWPHQKVKLVADQRPLSLTMCSGGSRGRPQPIVIPSHKGKASQVSITMNNKGLMGQQTLGLIPAELPPHASGELREVKKQKFPAPNAERIIHLLVSLNAFGFRVPAVNKIRFKHTTTPYLCVHVHSSPPPGSPGARPRQSSFGSYRVPLENVRTHGPISHTNTNVHGYLQCV